MGKKIFRKVLVLFLACVFAGAFLFGCFPEGYQTGLKTEYFRYYISELNGGGKFIQIIGLTELGAKQKILVIPEEIDGIKVTSVNGNSQLAEGVTIATGRWESKNLEKVFFPNENYSVYNNTFRDCSNFKKAIIVDCGISYSGGSSNSISGSVYQGEYCYISKPVYEKWVEETVGRNNKIQPANISYYYNYETDTNYEIYWIDDVNYGEKIEYIPKDPIREGYNFGGWYKEEECINKWSFETDTLPEELLDEADKVIYQETALYVKWIKK